MKATGHDGGGYDSVQQNADDSGDDSVHDSAHDNARMLDAQPPAGSLSFALSLFATKKACTRAHQQNSCRP